MEAICRLSCIALFVFLFNTSIAQSSAIAYSNPLIHTDYSDPDVIRVGSDYYMTASSFNFVPGLPILHSKDLVRWKLIGYALQKNIPDSAYQKVQHGGGVWAPSIRYINKKFIIFYPDPDRGIYKVEARNITGPWTAPQLVMPGKGLIDPCALQHKGKNYLVYALAGSRAGLKSVLLLTQLSPKMDAAIGSPKLVFDGHQDDATVEGPKLYLRNGWFYIFAPAGGVKTGWQLVLRSRKIEGPYEKRIVLQQGKTNINGPHQGAWVNDLNGRDWFLHFQDKGPYGRIVHLQPMRWVNEWPEMGDFEHGRTGEPVLAYGKTATAIARKSGTKLFEDYFSGVDGWKKEWQWSANPNPHWAFVYADQLRLFAVDLPAPQKNLWNFPAWFTLKLPADSFVAVAKIHAGSLLDGEEFGVGLLGTDYARLFFSKDSGRLALQYATCLQADQGKVENNQFREYLLTDSLQIRIRVLPSGYAFFGYSLDGKLYQEMEEPFQLRAGKWVGTRLGFFCLRRKWLNDAGAGNIDWIIIQ